MKLESQISPRNWLGAATPVDIHLYVLELEDDCFYVGLTAYPDQRVEQHVSGKGAAWTQLHKPRRVVHMENTGTQDCELAARHENDVTIALMRKHGIANVRGGYFCGCSPGDVEVSLRAHGHWTMLKRAGLKTKPVDIERTWSEAIESFLVIAESYYDSGTPGQDAVFAAMEALTRHPEWRDDFAPALEPEFWRISGVLPILLSIKLGRAVGSASRGPYEVVAAAFNRTKKNAQRFRPLYMLVWQAYVPAVTDNQAAAVSARLMPCLSDGNCRDRCYDSFVSVLLPEARHLLRHDAT